MLKICLGLGLGVLGFGVRGPAVLGLGLCGVGALGAVQVFGCRACGSGGGGPVWGFKMLFLFAFWCVLNEAGRLWVLVFEFNILRGPINRTWCP